MWQVTYGMQLGDLYICLETGDAHLLDFISFLLNKKWAF